MKRSDAVRSIAAFACAAIVISPQANPLVALAKKRPDDPGMGVVRAGDNVVIESTDIRPTMEDAADGNIFYLVKFKFTNGYGAALIPQVSKFVLEDDDKVRHAAMDSGSPELAGISNDFNVALKPGDTHEYTVGFRVKLNTEGTLFYDPT